MSAISIHALRVEGDQYYIRRVSIRAISIHALRVEGDFSFTVYVYVVVYFYPRPPGGGRRALRRSTRLYAVFLSTPSGWRATPRGADFIKRHQHISIHALRVEGDVPDLYIMQRGGWISIHALRVEGDTFRAARGPRTPISIHALRVEGDGGTLHGQPAADIFLSTPSGWRATQGFRGVGMRLRFLSTPSGWRATVFVPAVDSRGRISIHALRVEGDFYA